MPISTPKKRILIKDLGYIRYDRALVLQQKLLYERIQQKKKRTPENYVLFCEHPPVYTMGSKTKKHHLLVSDQVLKRQKAVLCQTNRGGDITYHGPGQLVVYFIWDLDQFFHDIHRYIRLLENIVIQTLTFFGIEATTFKGLTGVWIQGKTDEWEKICAIGIRASRWVTMHGLALNVNTDMQYFKNIIPCGIQDKKVTSIKKILQKQIAVSLVKKKMSNFFLEIETLPILR